MQERLSFDKLSDKTVSEWLEFSEGKIRSKVSLSHGKLKLIEHASDFYYSSNSYIINCDLTGVEIEFYGGVIPSRYIYVYPGFYDGDYRYKAPNLEFDMASIAEGKLKSILCDHTAKVMHNISLGR